MQYNRIRVYDPKAGRWFEPDPIGFAGGDRNLYRYVWNGSMNFIDPVGLLGFGPPGNPPGTGTSPLNYDWQAEAAKWKAYGDQWMKDYASRYLIAVYESKRSTEAQAERAAREMKYLKIRMEQAKEEQKKKIQSEIENLAIQMRALEQLQIIYQREMERLTPRKP